VLYLYQRLNVLVLGVSTDDPSGDSPLLLEPYSLSSAMKAYLSKSLHIVTGDAIIHNDNQLPL